MLNELLVLLENGPDNAILRLSLGIAYLKTNEIDKALLHLAKAVELDPRYSAAWKVYGKTLLQMEEVDKAERVLTQGIQVATEKGDIQAAKEMEVFLKRLHQGV